MINRLNMMATPMKYVLPLLCIMLLAACQREQPGDPDVPVVEPVDDAITPEQSAAARTALVDWLECEECEEGQLSLVVKNADLLKPMLMSTLRSGAAPASVELYRIELEKRHDELMAYSQNHPHAKPSLPKDEFVALYLGRLDAQYKTRAAEALGAIGGEDAQRALGEALAGEDRDDIRASYQAALDSIQ